MASPSPLPQLTVRDRILLHLSEHAGSEEEYQAPVQVTQTGVAEAVGIRLSHVPQYIRPMGALGLVMERSAHVKGGRQRRKVYFLTAPGKSEAARIKSNLLSTKVEVHTERGRQSTTLAEALRGAFRGVPLLEITKALEAQGFLRVPREGPGGPAAPAWVDLTHEAPVLQYFYGRVQELEQLKQLLALRKVVVVQGVAGIGKSTLAARLVDLDRGTGHLLWHQFRTWDNPGSILRALAQYLHGAGRPGLSRHLQATAALDMTSVEAILDRDLAGLQGVLVYDDLHKAPPPVVQVMTLLRSVLTRVDGPKLLFLTREHVPFYDRRDVQVKGTVGEMELGGLDPEAARELLGGRVADAQVALEAAKGHPLLLELMRTGLSLPAARADLARFLEEELYLQLSEGERAVAKLGSLYEDPVPAEALLLAGGTQEDLSHLRRRGVVRQAQGGLLQVHDALRDYLRGVLGMEEHDLRRRASEGLMAIAAGGPAEGRAPLALLQEAAAVAPPGPVRAGALQRLGDARLEAGGFRDALESYEAVLSAGGEGGPLHERVARAYLALGDVVSALGASERALAATPDSPEALMVGGEALLRSGNPPAALPRLQRAAKAVAMLPPVRAAKAKSLLGEAMALMGDAEAGMGLLEAAVGELRGHGGRVLVDALLALGLQRLRLGHYNRAREALAEAQGRAHTLEDGAREARAWTLLGLVAFHAEDYEATLENVWRGKNLGDALRDRSTATIAQFVFGLIEEVQCYASHTLGLYESALALMEETGERLMADLIHYHRALTWADAGDLGRAEEALREARNQSAVGQGHWALEDGSQAFEAGVMLRAARWPEALEGYREASRMVAKVGRSEALHLERAEWALAAAKARELQEAESLGGATLQEAERRGLRRTRALALTALGLVRAAQGRGAEAVAAFQDALQLNTALGLEPWIGRCRLDYARALLALGRKAKAREELANALQTLESNRMEGDLVRAQQLQAELEGR